ncbi:class I SAM-dependent methyltransferase [Microscilla marina]|uniref:Putative methyltransferase family n=1 Tax=Microscilla marina ATCC 23134 TaxID=313606 RepID=A1ZI91_MICM2|nr:class I SAM-dependent methyltransferase [Microscilla marina]EAY29759.1 putative methyltransferase family [Microscilla marina ATCC 23134]
MEVKEDILTNIAEGGWIFPQETWDNLSGYEKSFINNEFTGIRTLENYKKRLEFHGFTNMDRVLDAGCGYGQWAHAMAAFNQHIDGVDIDNGRLKGAQEIAKAMNINNVQFQNSPLETLPFPDNYFDGIFCYSVFMFTDMPKALQQFNRVLKPSGKLYINTDTIGWYFHLFLDVPRDRLNALRMLARTLLGYKKNIIVREKWLKKQLKNAGFEIISLGVEGETSINSQTNKNDALPFYPQRYYNRKSILEVIAKKTTR